MSDCEYKSHEVSDLYSSVVLVLVSSECILIRYTWGSLNEWIRNHAVAGLECNLGLEGVRIDAA